MSTSKRACPSCAALARTVSVGTVQRLVRDPARTEEWEQAWFCAEADCDVVYFGGDGSTLDRPAVRVGVFQKETAPERLVCYCFEHRVADVLDADAGDGSNRVLDSIMDACGRGLDRCEEMNPQGRCCLGNVRSLLGQKSSPGCC